MGVSSVCLYGGFFLRPNDTDKQETDTPLFVCGQIDLLQCPIEGIWRTLFFYNIMHQANKALNTPVPRERIIAFDILRIIAALAVITIHVSAQYYYTTDFSDEWEIRNIYDGLSRWCVPVFVMISGALFLDSKKEINLKKLYGKNLLRIVVAYFVWSIVYTLYGIIHNHSFVHIGVTAFLKGIVQGYFHLWFLKMLMGLYIVIPVLKHIVTNKKIEHYFLILALVFTFFLPFVLRCIELLHIECFSFFYKDMRLSIASGYVGYFMLGHYLITNHLSRRLRHWIYFAGIACAVCIVVLNSLFSHCKGEPTEEFFGYLHPLTLFVSVAIFLFVLENSERVPSKCYPFIRNVSAMSFGIYLVHMLVVNCLHDDFGLDSATFHPVFAIPCVCLLTFVVSYAIIRLLYILPAVNKYIL